LQPGAAPGGIRKKLATLATLATLPPWSDTGRHRGTSGDTQEPPEMPPLGDPVECVSRGVCK
jgi:hypothetical protein